MIETSINVYPVLALNHAAKRRTSFLLRFLSATALILASASFATAQTYDIRSYGARCNGSDDSGAVNAALNAVPNGATLYVSCQAGIGPAGLLIHNKNGVTVEGTNGGGFYGLANNNAAIIFRIEVCDNCTIRNLIINANFVGAGGLGVYFSSNAVLENNSVTNVSPPANAAIAGMGNRGNRYSNNTVNRTTANSQQACRGIWIGNPSTQLFEWNPTVSNNTVRDVAATGIVLHAISPTVSGNLVDAVQGAGIKVTPPPGLGGQALVQNNTITNSAFHGIQIDRADSPVNIQNNTISGSAQNGIYESNGSGGNYPNSQISGNTLSNNVRAGIHLYDANGIGVQNNRITGGNWAMIFEGDYSNAINNVQVTGNTISDVGLDAIALWARGGTISNFSISSNSIYNIPRYGVQVEEQWAGAVSNFSMSNNCFANTRAGTLLDLRLVNRILAPSTAGSCGTASSSSAGATSSGATSTSTSTSSVVTPPSTPSTPSTPAASAIRINAGAGQYTDPSGAVWSADSGSSAGYAYVVGNSIRNTSTPALYQSVRWNDRVLDYNFNVPSGSRTVTLKFAETYFTSAGRRVFSVWINGQQVLTNFDIVAEAGGANAAVDRSFTVQSTGQVTIHMVSTVDDPMVNAIEIK